MPELIAGFMITLISLVVGYSLGRGRFDKSQATTILNNIKEGFTQATAEKKLGAFNYPTATEIELNENPQLKAEMEEMEKVFENGKV